MPTLHNSGLSPAFEYFQTKPPANPQTRDSATLWIMDSAGRLALPRVTFDAIGESWDMPWAQLNYVQSDGKTMRVWSQEPGRALMNSAGKCIDRRAGRLRFSCIEPFRLWSVAFDGTAMQSTSKSELTGSRDRSPAPLAFHFEAEMVAPPWLMGGMTEEAAQQMSAGDGSALMGGIRYEQLCRISGWVAIGGKRQIIEGTGMRVRRQGVRNMGAALGHCQHSALFPSGKAFGAIIMAAGPTGQVAFNEAFLFTADGVKVPARVISAPWMTRLTAGGDDASLVLDSEIGTVRIEGKTLLSMFDHHDFEMADSSILHQGTARYLWDGEETIGLIERCTQRDRLEGYGQ